MSLIDKLTAQRQKLLIIAAIGFFMWQGGLLLKEALPLDDTAQWFGMVMTLVGAFQWALFSIGFVHFSRKAKPELETLNDELPRANRHRSWTVGYVLLLGSIALLLGVSQFWVLNSKLVIHGLMIIGIVLPILYFVWLERDNG